MNINKGNHNSFTMIDENGNEVTYEILFTFESDDNVSYVVYTDNREDEVTGEVLVYASTLTENGTLEPIKTEKEWKVIEAILSTIQEEAKKTKAKVED